MGTEIRYSDVVDLTGDDVVSCADRIQTLGNELYAYLNNLVANGQLTGPGISEALTVSQGRWNEACAEFARAESELGGKMKDAYHQMMATDMRAGGYF